MFRTHLADLADSQHKYDKYLLLWTQY